MTFPQVPLRRWAAIPITNGVGEAAEHDDPSWPRYIRTTDIASTTSLRAETFKSLPWDVARKASLERGDLLLCAAGSVGLSHLYDDEGSACYAGYLVRVRPAEPNSSRFLAYWAQSDHFWTQIRVGVVKSTIENFSAGKYRAMKAPQPSPVLQRAIADFLDRKTAAIDALIEKKERLLALLAEKRAALIHRAVTKGLDPTVPMKDSGIPWIGEIPAHWDVLKMGQGFAVVGSGTTPESHREEFYDPDGTPWVTTAELRESKVSRTHKGISTLGLRRHSALKVFPPGSLMVAMYGATIGRLGILDVSACCNQAVCVLSRPISFSVEFVYFWLQAMREHVLMLASGGGQPNISQEKVRSIRVPCPSVAEQEIIGRQLAIGVESLAVVVNSIERQIDLLREYRQALITAAVTGQLAIDEVAA